MGVGGLPGSATAALPAAATGAKTAEDLLLCNQGEKEDPVLSCSPDSV
jgi:hypothetical protein